MNILKLIGYMMLVTLLFWIIMSTFIYKSQRPYPEVLGIGSAFQGNMHLLRKLSKNSFRMQGKECWLSVHDNYKDNG